MALQKQEIPLAFTEGVDTKTDEKLVSKLSVMENCYIGEKGTPVKRNGFEQLSNTRFTSGEQLIVNKGVLGLIAPNQFAVRNTQDTTGWREDLAAYKSSNINTTYENVNIPLSDFLPGGLQLATGASDSVIAFNGTNELTSGVFSHTFGFFRRNSDGSIIRRPVLDETSSSRFDGGCIVSLSNKVWWIFKTGTTITATDLSVNANSYTSTTITTTATASQYMQAYVQNGLIFILYVDNAGDLTVSSYNSLMVNQATFTHTTEARAILGSFSISWNSTRSLYGVFYQTMSGGNMYLSSVYLTSALVISGSIVSNVRTLGSGSAYYKVTSCYNPATTEIFAAFDNLDTGITFCSSDPTTLSESFTVGRSQLASQAFILNSVPHVAIDKFNLVTGLTTTFSFKLSAVTLLMDYRGYFSAQLTSAHLVYPLYTLGQLDSTKLPLSTGVNGFVLCNIDSSNYNNSSPSEISGQSVVFNSGSNGFDGNSFSELGFLSYPFADNIAQSGGAGLAAGTYQYAIAYKYKDINGNVYFSAPYTNDSALSIVLAGPNRVTFNIHPYCPSKKYEGVTAEVYRKSLTDTVYKKVGSLEVDLNSASPTLYTDELSVNAENETLYTTGGILENDPSPVANIFWTHQNRVFCVDEENPTRIYFSKANLVGEGIHFSSFLYLTADESPNGSYQRVTGGASLDDKLIIFKSDSIYASYGDGPNNLGVGTFALPRLISPDVGCRDARSIVNTSEGIMFMSKKGIYLLTRSLEAVYIGADVEAYNSEEITSALLYPTINQVRFTTRAGVCLAYSYYYKQWAWFTNYQSQHAVIYNGKLSHLKSTGYVRSETTGFLDIATAITQKLAISWLKASGIENVQRVYRIQFIGDYKSAHKVSVNLYFDYEEYVWDNVTVTPLSSGYNTITKPAINDVYNGANNGTYEYEIQVSRQKCEAFKVELSDFDHSGESFSLTGMSLVVGIKKGLNKLSGNKQF